LTAEISKTGVGMTPDEYRHFKGLERGKPARPHDDLELIFSMLGEAATTEIARKQDSQGFVEIRVQLARVAGSPRGQEKTGGGNRPRVSTPENYLDEPESPQKLEAQKGRQGAA